MWTLRFSPSQFGPRFRFQIQSAQNEPQRSDYLLVASSPTGTYHDSLTDEDLASARYAVAVTESVEARAGQQMFIDCVFDCDEPGIAGEVRMIDQYATCIMSCGFLCP
jgi:hypothetical protein